MLTLKKGTPLYLISFQYRGLITVTSQKSAEFCWHSTQFVKSALLQTRNNYFNSNLFWLKDSAGDVEDSKTQLSQFPFQLRTLKQVIWKKFSDRKSEKTRQNGCGQKTAKQWQRRGTFIARFFKKGFCQIQRPVLWKRFYCLRYGQHCL